MNAPNDLTWNMVQQNIPTRILQRALIPSFDPVDVSRGAQYFRSQAVSELEVRKDQARGEVLGTTVYQVRLAWPASESRGQINVSCSCPHFSEDHLCKHIWAFVLELDEQGYSRAIPIRRRIEVILNGLPEWTSSPLVIEGEAAFGGWRKAFQSSDPLKPSQAEIEPPTLFIVINRNARDEDAINLNFFSSTRDEVGEFSEPKPFALGSTRHIQFKNPALQSVLHAVSILATGEVKNSNHYGRYFTDPSVRTFKTWSIRSLLNVMIETNMVFGSTTDFLKSMQTGQSLHFTRARFGELELKVSETETGYSLDCDIEVNTVKLPVQKLEKFAGPNLFAFGQQLGFVDLADSHQKWFQELSKDPVLVPKEESEAFLEAMLNQTVKFNLPKSLQWERVRMKPTAVLHLTVDRKSVLQSNNYLVDLKFQYGPRVVSQTSPGLDLVSGEDQKIYARDRLIEDKIFSQLPSDLFSPKSRMSEVLPSVSSKNLFAFAQAALAAGIPMRVENRSVQEASDFKISVSSGVDWFDVEGQAEFSGRWIKIPTILEALMKGENFVPLEDGTLGLIDEQMAKRLEKLSGFADTTKQGIRFAKSQALILNSLIDNEKDIVLDDQFIALRKKIRDFNGVHAAKTPAQFTGKLRKYQKEGLGWLEFLEDFGLGGVLADDMGLGKTIQCLAFLSDRRKKSNSQPSLLLAPKSLLQNWFQEAQKFTPSMKVYVHAGMDRKTTTTHFKKNDLIITTYQTMLRDLELLKEVHWDCLILDEAQAIKNPGALISKASKLLPAQFRLAMTGTPIENSIQDLFSISDFVNPGFLSGKRKSSQLKLGEESREVLSRAFKPVVLRRTKDQVLKDLPEKTEQVIYVELEERQLKTYNELKKFYQAQIMNQVKESGIQNSQMHILAALTRLRQAALHSGLIDSTQAQTKSAKFEIVLEMLDEIIQEGHRILIFSQFTSLLALFKTELEKQKIAFSYLDGKTANRQEVVDHFRTSDNPVFLMSLKAGGVGLNLVEADYVFLLDPWWNPAVEAQAIDRVHRIGQKRAVNAYRFIAKDTVEEKILALQQTKRGISDDILGEKSSLLKNLTASDIENLLS
jgi:superfamily II DNA or RNA helicase